MKKFFLPVFLPQILFTALILLLMIVIPLLQPFDFPVKMTDNWYTSNFWIAILPYETFMLAFLYIAVFGNWNRGRENK